MAFTTNDGKTQTALAEINMVPFIDVVLVLLIIFMVTAPVIQSGIEVSVPKTTYVREIEEEKIMVTINAGQKVYLQNQEVNINELGQKIRDKMPDPSRQSIYLLADESVPFGVFATVMDRLKAVGIDNISIVTQPLEKGKKMTAPDKLNRWLVMSIFLHCGFAAVVLFAPGLFPFQGSESWGSANAGEGMNVKIVSGGISGMALPSPEVTTENAAANDSKGFYKSEPTPAPPPEPEAVPIPTKNAVIPKKSAPPKSAPATPAPKAPPAPPPPTNAVPYGQGGNPNVGYGQFSTQSGGIAGFGDGAFGSKYAEYVQAMVRRISQNWLKGLVDSRVTQAPRVYVSFDIGRDGKVSNVSIQQSSGIPTLDNSAMRAIYASNPLQPLPRDYSGSNVNVKFYFEYIK